MKVTLLNSYSNEKMADIGASICIGKHKKTIAYSNSNHMIAAIDSDHLSVIEHLPLSFLIENVSRSLLAQLTRHRHMSFSVISQRYSKAYSKVDETWYVKPNTINEKFDFRYRHIMDMLDSMYYDMIEDGIPQEDARYILPNACHTSLILSCNARAFAEACNKRTCEKAQWEIRELFTTMRECIQEIYPNIYSLCFPNCEANNSLGCKEKYPCDKYDNYEG